MADKLYIKTFGCQMNEYDTEKISEIFHSKNKTVRTDQPEEADIILFNTCSVREKAQEKVFSDLGEEIGLITSGTFGPSINASVAMGYINSEFSEIGTKIQLEVRGKKHGGKVSELPFFKKSYVK